MDGSTANTLRLFTTVLTAAVAYFNYAEVDPNLRPINVPDSGIQQEYDFIIVGGGSAGSVLANRLTEISNWTVLLLEAGGDETVVSDTPLLNYNLWFSDMDWNYTTTEQQYACRLSNGSCTWPRGHVIGGSSVVNDFVYMRGNRMDYDGWANDGNQGWSYQEVLPYFIKSESNVDPSTADSPYHGQEGPMTVGRSPFSTPLRDIFLNAGADLGYPNVDLNGPSQIGLMTAQGYVRNGSRCSTAKGYLRPVRNRTNLNIAMRALVTKIVINPQTKTATGVTFTRHGSTFNVTARKEVIVSGGIVNSPQLLMLSGIGPQDHLDSLGIPVIQNLMVGDNLHDHVGAPMLFTVNANVTVNWRSSYENASAILDYAMNGRGPLTSLLGVEAVASVYIDAPNANGIPDAEVMMVDYVPINQDGQMLAFVPFYLHPQSRGTVRLRNTDPTSMPLIDPGYLTRPEDIQSSINVLKFIIQLSQTKALQQIGIQFYSQFYPLCTQYSNTTDQYLLCLLTNYSVTIYHPVGSCKMGPSSDPTAVVNSRLQVYGVNNLRVIDASVIPRITSSNTNGPTIMVAERAADLIKQDYGLLPSR